MRFATAKNACGFCTIGYRHDLCPGGVQNGNGDLVRCPCGCLHSQMLRCLSCGERAVTEEGRIDPATWLCTDSAACASRSASRGPVQARVPEKRAKRSETPRKAAGACLCCGETTGGGKFRPGHDSRYLSELAADIRSGGKSLEMVVLGMQASGLSTALQDKLRHRVAI